MTLTKGKLVFEDGSDMSFQFNPAELKIAKTSKWRPLPSTGRASPPASEYVSGAPSTLSLNLLLDTTDTGESVTTKTDKLQALVEIDKSNSAYDSSNKTGRPPWVSVMWNELVPFKCICKSLTITFTYFAPDSTPLRAKADISLQQFNDPENPSAQNPTSGTPRPHRLHTVQVGESLDRIAAKHYGNATKWRLIADANLAAFDDPMRIPPGTLLVIPQKRNHRHG